MKEKEIQSAIIQYLTLKKILHWRQNSGTFKTVYRMGIVGAPDIFAVKESKIYGIEVKNEKGKLSDGQILFRQQFEKAGGIYLVARSIDDVLAYF